MPGRRGELRQPLADVRERAGLRGRAVGDGAREIGLCRDQGVEPGPQGGEFCPDRRGVGVKSGPEEPRRECDGGRQHQECNGLSIHVG